MTAGTATMPEQDDKHERDARRGMTKERGVATAATSA